MRISVGVACAQFVGIVIYHVWLHVSKILSAKKYMLSLKNKFNKGRAQAGEGNEQYYAYQLMPEDSDKVTVVS